jgi:hypothetical protein
MARPLHTSDPYEGFTEEELRQVLVGQIETYAELDLVQLLEMGEEERVKRIIERLMEQMSKRIT